MKEEFVSTEQIRLVPKRLKTAKLEDVSKRFLSKLEGINLNSKNILVVGAGGSYPAAASIALDLSWKNNKKKSKLCSNASFETPQNAIHLLKNFNNNLNVAIAVSYSGVSPDIVNFWKTWHANKPGKKFFLITGEDEKKVKKAYSTRSKCLEIISYFSPEDTTGKEKGFISMFATLAPVIIANGMNEATVEKVWTWSDDIKLNTDQLQFTGNDSFVHIFYDYEAYPAALYLRSCFLESGLATEVLLHEEKNFSHGEYISYAINSGEYTIFLHGSNVETGYDKKFKKFLWSNNFISIYGGSADIYEEHCRNNLFMLMWAIHAVQKTGEDVDLDISKPLEYISKEIHGGQEKLEGTKTLYKYDGDI